MKYIVYLTINRKSTVNGLNRIYIGVHKTKNPEIFDGYIGCGVCVQQPSTYMYPKTPFQYAVKKYGTKSFYRIILYVFNSEKEAYAKEAELVNIDFIKQSHVYNATVGGVCTNTYKPLFQFNLKGELVKKWQYSKEAYEFYNLPMQKFYYAIFNKHPLLDSLWSYKDTIDVSEYSTKTWGEPEVTHLYDINGKWLNEFISRKECGEFIGVSKEAISRAVLHQRVIQNKYYVSCKKVDLFVPKKRKQYTDSYFYIYNSQSILIGQGKGKEIMPILGTHSWSDIKNAFRYKNGWYKDLFISTEVIEQVPERVLKNCIKVDIYTKYGEFIETLPTVKEVREKYHVKSSKIKNLEMGDRFFGDYIFKYHKGK